VEFNASAYGPAAAALLQSAPCNALGRGVPVATRRTALAELKPEAVVAPHALRNPDMALACLAGLWLRYDFLDESHAISQSLENPTGSFWHAIVHRREGDFSNSKYWFRRVGKHAVYGPLAAAARQLAEQGAPGRWAGYLLERTDWEPFRFVELCQRARDDAPAVRDLCMQIQQREWELLFDDCYRLAIGR
jgi:hypothetical protein